MEMFKDRVFNLAILLSIAWHVFWLSVITVVAAPRQTQVKFSKVSFLGPILERGALDVRIEPRERSFLEKRYMAGIEKLSALHEAGQASQKARSVKYASDKGLRALVEEAVGGVKLEPSSEIY